MSSNSHLFKNLFHNDLRDSGHLEMTTLGDFGSQMRNGFTIHVEVQSESAEEQVLCGTGTSEKTALFLTLNASSEPGRLEMLVRDDRNKTLQAYAQFSEDAGKRLVIAVEPPTNSVRVREVTIHEGRSLDVTYVRKESPSEFSDFEYPFLFSGCSLNGSRYGTFTGKIGLPALWRNALTDTQMDGLLDASRAEIEQAYGTHRRVSRNAERDAIFVDDLARLRRWNTQSGLSRVDMRDASTVLFMWLFDRNPLLKDMCDELGIQLSMPGQSDSARTYIDKVLLDMEPSYFQTGDASSMAYQWVSLQQYEEQTVFHIEGHTVSCASFIRFLRHKLGGGHFDAVERKKWQRDLKAFTDHLELGGLPSMVHQLRAVIRETLWSVDSCGVERQFRLRKG